MNQSPDTAEAREDVVAAETFRSRLECVYALSAPHADALRQRDGRPLVVNVIDPSNQLIRSTAADLRAALLASVGGQVADPLAFAVIELDRCAGADTVAQEALAQILFAFDAVAAPSEAERDIGTLFTAVRRDLLPWSPSSLYELERWAQGTLTKRPLVLAMRGADLLDAESALRVLRIAHAVAGSVCARLLFVLSERRPYDCDLRILNPPPDRNRFVEETLRLLPGEAQRAGDDVAPEQPASPARSPAPRSSDGRNGFWQRFIDWISPRARAGADGDGREVAELICAATYPSYRLRDRALGELAAYAHGVRSAATLPAPAQGGARPAPPPDAPAATDAARAALFLKLLEVAFPNVMHATQSQPDGYHRLYRLQLSLVPQRHRAESTQAVIAPEWVEFSRSPRLRAFFAYAMSEIGGGEPRVRPFVSATAIKRHLLGLMDGRQRPGSDDAYRTGLVSLQAFCKSVAEKVLGKRTALGDALRAAEREHRDGVDDLVSAAKETADESASQRISAAVARVRDSAFRLREAKRLLDENIAYAPEGELRAQLSSIEPTFAPDDGRAPELLEPGDVIEECLRHLAFLEIKDVVDEASVKRRIGDLRAARDQTDGALGLDAELGIARGYSLLRAKDDAADALNAAASWAGADPLGRAAVDLGKAFWRERDGDFKGAEELCLDVLHRADALGARELTARAAYGVTRCRIAGEKRPTWQSFFRARAFLSIQAARSPFLSEVLRGTGPRMFISYRRAQEDLLRRLRDSFRTVGPAVSIWVDFEAIDEQHTEFRPAMQLGLDLSDAVLLVFSPEYFESPWCSYELTTAIARRRSSGQHVFWVCVDPTAAGETSSESPREYVRRIAQRAATSPAEQAFFTMQLEVVLATEPAYGSVLSRSPDAEALTAIAAHAIERLERREPRRPAVSA